VAVNLNGLAPEDVRVEVLMGRASKQGQDKDLQAVPLKPEGWDGQDCLFTLELTPECAASCSTVCGSIPTTIC
jgi:starch phosphorylase